MSLEIFVRLIVTEKKILDTGLSLTVLDANFQQTFGYMEGMTTNFSITIDKSVNIAPNILNKQWLI